MAFEGLTDKLAAAFKKLRAKGKLTEADVKEAMREVRLALLEADVNYKVAKDFIATVSARAVGADVLESLTPAQQLIKIVNDELTTLMGSTNSRINISNRIPTVIMMCGLQGAGKTTHSGKLGLMLKGQGHRPLLVACDIYRPAAIKQLQVVGEQVGVPVFEMGTENPVKIAREAIKLAIVNPEIINSITKKLYPTIADKFSTSASKVERAIRHAIEVAWNRGKIENINNLFGIKVYSTNEKPTNGEFIALVADKMLIEGA